MKRKHGMSRCRRSVSVILGILTGPPVLWFLLLSYGIYGTGRSAPPPPPQEPVLVKKDTHPEKGPFEGEPVSMASSFPRIVTW